MLSLLRMTHSVAGGFGRLLGSTAGSTYRRPQLLHSHNANMLFVVVVDDLGQVKSVELVRPTGSATDELFEDDLLV